MAKHDVWVFYDPVVSRVWVRAVPGLLVLLAACGGGSSSSGNTTATPSSAVATTAGPPATATTVAPTITLAPPPRYDGVGSFDVGVSSIQVGDRIAYVYYPIDKGSAGAAAKWTYNATDAYDPPIRPLIPKFLAHTFEFDAYADPTPSAKGPFPVILASHGFGGFPTDDSHTNVHTASWGFVVIAPDHRERDRMTQAGRKVDLVENSDVKDLFNALDTVSKDSKYTAVLDTKRIATSGLSAGGRAAIVAAADPRVTTWIAEAAAVTNPNDQPPTSGPARTVTADPGKFGILLGGDHDEVVPPTTVSTFYDRLAAPKRSIVVGGAGHNSFTDSCPVILAQGGLVQYAQQLNLKPELLKLGENGCTKDFVDPAAITPFVQHLTVGLLRSAFGLDPYAARAIAPANLTALFPEVQLVDHTA
jgi:dienelactone hydrolase